MELFINFLTNFTGEQDELAGAQSLAGRSDAGSDEVPTTFKTPTSLLISPPTKDLFTKFMKVFMETTQAQVLAEVQERPLKPRTPETYWGKSHIKYYHFCL